MMKKSPSKEGDFLIIELFSEDSFCEGGFAFPVHGIVDQPELRVPLQSGASVVFGDQPGTGRKAGLAEFFCEFFIQSENQRIGSQLEIVIAVGGKNTLKLAASGLAHMAAQAQDLVTDPCGVLVAQSAVGCHQTGQQIPGNGGKTVGDASAEISGNQQKSGGNKTQFQRSLAFQLQTSHAIKNKPAKEEAGNTQHTHNDQSPGVVRGNAVAHGDSGEQAQKIGQQTEKLDAAHGGADAARLLAAHGTDAVPGIVEPGTGGIEHHLAAEELLALVQH